MLAPPPRAGSYDLKVVDEEKREGYTARKIEFNLTGYSRVRAYLLVPTARGLTPEWWPCMTTVPTTR